MRGMQHVPSEAYKRRVMSALRRGRNFMYVLLLIINGANIRTGCGEGLTSDAGHLHHCGFPNKADTQYV